METLEDNFWKEINVGLLILIWILFIESWIQVLLNICILLKYWKIFFRPSVLIMFAFKRLKLCKIDVAGKWGGGGFGRVLVKCR